MFPTRIIIWTLRVADQQTEHSLDKNIAIHYSFLSIFNIFKWIFTKIRTKFSANFVFPEKEKHFHNVHSLPNGDGIHAFALFYKYWELLHLHPMAYFCVQLRAVASYLALSVLYMWAISGTSGSSGLGSVKREHIDSSTLEMVSAGLHCSLRISKHMLPLLLMFGWNTFVLNATFGGLKG